MGCLHLVRKQKSRDGAGYPGLRTGGTEEAPSQVVRFIWQLVGVLATYGSICLMGANV